MAVLSAGVALPLLAVGAIQAIARQEPGTLLRSALVRLPLALLFTGVSRATRRPRAGGDRPGERHGARRGG